MGFIQNQVKKLAAGAAGVALTLGWWTCKAPVGSDGRYEEYHEGELLEVVAGGGVRIAVSFEAAHEVYFDQGFVCAGEDTGEPMEFGASKAFPPGQHTVTVDVSGHCIYGSLELGLVERDPAVDTRLQWTVKADDVFWQRDGHTLEQPLEPGAAMFLQAGWEDSTLDEVQRWYRDNP